MKYKIIQWHQMQDFLYLPIEGNFVLVRMNLASTSCQLFGKSGASWAVHGEIADLADFFIWRSEDMFLGIMHNLVVVI